MKRYSQILEFDKLKNFTDVLKEKIDEMDTEKINLKEKLKTQNNTIDVLQKDYKT